MKLLLTTLLLSSASALRAPTLTRRAALGGATSAAFGLAVAPPEAQAALGPCPPGANNCWSSASTDKTKLGTWTWPADKDRKAAIAELEAAIEAYPQEGQAGVDLGGWKVVDNQLASSGYERIEYRSGIGNFAKFFNGGKPFVDDLEINVEDATVCLRSSSRVGDSDFNVNAKRLNYIADYLSKRGWNAKGPVV